MTAFVANTNVLELVGLKAETEDTFISDATVTVTIKDADDVEVVGGVWPMTMAYVASSDGNYRAILSNELELVAKTKYIATINADGGADRVGHWEFSFKPITRSSVDAS